MAKDIELGKRIARLRNDSGLEQKEAAELIGINPGTYQLYEYGNPPSRDNLKLILKHYKCDAGWLVLGEGDPYPDRVQDKQSPAAPIYTKDTLPSAAVVEAQKINIEEAMGKTYGVLTSGTPYAVALYLNIQQFASAVDATKELKVCRDLIAGLQSQVDDLRQQVNRLTASPTTAVQREAS